MVTLLKTGNYKLVETKGHVKVLYLDTQKFAWIEPKNIGEILVASRYSHKTDWMLSNGHYRLYDVEDEPQLVDQQRLELDTGNDTWQGYLLLTGLPDAQNKRRRIIPTGETITHNPLFTRVHGMREAPRAASRKTKPTKSQTPSKQPSSSRRRHA